jgi:hypothetical protein
MSNHKLEVALFELSHADTTEKAIIQDDIIRNIVSDLEDEINKSHLEIDKVMNNRNVGMCVGDSSLRYRVEELASGYKSNMDAIDEIAGLMEQVSALKECLRWRSAFDEMPEENVYVEVTDGVHVGVGVMPKENEWEIFQPGLYVVFKWRPIPLFDESEAE